MTKRQVNICDVCNKNIAEGKCDLCGKDFCAESECFSTTQLFLSGGGYSSLVLNIKSCGNCNNNLAQQNKEGFWNEDIKKNLFNKFIPYLKRKIMTFKLKGGEIKKKPKLPYTITIPSSIVSPRQIFPQTNPWTPFKPQNITPVTPVDKRIFKKHLKKFYRHLTGRKKLIYYDGGK